MINTPKNMGKDNAAGVEEKQQAEVTKENC
jgi:hypothetical protein